jgi:hypothetical protein
MLLKHCLYHCHLNNFSFCPCLCVFKITVNSFYWHFISSWTKTGVLLRQNILMFRCLQCCQLITNNNITTLLICMLHTLWTIPSPSAFYQHFGSMDCMKTHNIFFFQVSEWTEIISLNGADQLDFINKTQHFTFMWPCCIVTNFFTIKPTRCSHFTNLFWHETLHVSEK